MNDAGILFFFFAYPQQTARARDTPYAAGICGAGTKIHDCTLSILLIPRQCVFSVKIISLEGFLLSYCVQPPQVSAEYKEVALYLQRQWVHATEDLFILLLIGPLWI